MSPNATNVTTSCLAGTYYKPSLSCLQIEKSGGFCIQETIPFSVQQKDIDAGSIYAPYFTSSYFRSPDDRVLARSYTDTGLVKTVVESDCTSPTDWVNIQSYLFKASFYCTDESESPYLSLELLAIKHSTCTSSPQYQRIRSKTPLANSSTPQNLFWSPCVKTRLYCPPTTPGAPTPSRSSFPGASPVHVEYVAGDSCDTACIAVATVFAVAGVILVGGVLALIIRRAQRQ